MRVLHLCAGKLYGGIETFLTMLARRSDLCASLEHHFAICFEGRLSHQISACGAPNHPLGQVRSSRPWTVLRVRKRLQGILRGKFDVVVTHGSWPHAVFGATVRRARLPLVFYLHGPIQRLSWLDRWASWTRPDRVIAVSQDTAHSGRLIFPGVRTEVLNYALPWTMPLSDPAKRARLRRELGVTQSQTAIIQVSRMDLWKGHRIHLSAMEKLPKDADWRCWIVGGAQRPIEQRLCDELHARVAKSGLGERVKFLGERNDIGNLLEAADIYCQPNTGPEGFSLAFMEACASGLPVVTSRLGGAPELIDESCGVLIAPGDVDGLATALTKLIANRELRQRLGENARRRVHSLCDPARQVSRLAAILESVVIQRTTDIGR
ncbi:MAG: glycosyltransferase family 4 protein [Tepidisphaeraceae bacterium]